MIAIRYCKTSLVATIAAFFTFVAFGNLTDYGTNWLFVQHVLSMDTTFPDSSLHWRAITNPTIQTIIYCLVIAAETLTAVVLWMGALRLLRTVKTDQFAAAKTTAVVGLTLGLLLYIICFVVVGSEWFAMWQSEVWNSQGTAFNFISMIGVVLVILLLPEG